MDFVIGGLAGAGATIFTNPMDVVKTRFQLQGELRARHEHTARYRGILHALYVIGKNDGILALQKGLAPAMLLGFTMNSVRLGMYHIAEVQGWTKCKDGEISINKTMFWSSASGVMSGLAANPVSVVKTRIQAAAHPSIAVGRQYRYKGMFDGFITIYKSEGLAGFFAGVNATCARLAVGSAAQLTTFSTLKEYILGLGYCENAPVKLAFAASIVSGVLCVLLETPLDVVNTRLYNQGPASTGERLYNGVLDCLTKIYTKEGLHGLYKGLGPLYLRIAPHTTLSLVIWDMLNNLFDKNKHS
ncbi:PREDICTED: solute carrier family 25 member 35-like isoform X2 [Papilio xuthus]|uniref:Solute carrier family 25 member 35-like isoform X2 n=1 Tax=Papilio xuthus TaxID=66420 RepID=A0AAJ6ZX36_PAPXU|nr:PREDICTED: solute carrier family 25 member 35-like isoform X2 [Papilio xuthus]